MSKVIHQITKWQEERGLASQPYNPRTEIKNIAEELLEAIGCKDDDITKWITEEIMMHENIVEPPNEEEKVDAYADIIVFCIGAILKLGYEPNLVLKEVVKEINSRGGSIGPDGKWLKEITGNEYKANYKTCRRNK